MEIGEVACGTGRTVDRLYVGHELNEIARHEPGGEPEVPAELHQQPRRIAARAGLQLQRLFDRLHTGIEPHDVPDVGLQLSINPPARRRSVAYGADALQVSEPRRQRLVSRDAEFPALHLIVGERELFGGRFEKNRRVHNATSTTDRPRRKFAHSGKREAAPRNTLSPAAS
jgi:hypothetical protein